MSQICVVRGAGDSQAEDIVEPLLSSLSAKLERARVLFNEEKGSRVDMDVVSGVHISGAMPGDTLKIVEGSRSNNNAKITRVRHVFRGGQDPTLETIFKTER